MIANDENSVLKWTLNRSEEAKNTSELLKMADIDPPADIYKALRPSQILKSESFTNQIMKILSQEYINPFGADLDTSLLYNLSSGVPVDKSLSDGILKIKETGKELLETFADEVLVNRKTNFHQSIKREKTVLFESSLKKKKVSKTIEINRNILGNLVALSAKN